MQNLPRQQRGVALILVLAFSVGYFLWGWEYLSHKQNIKKHNEMLQMVSQVNLLTVHVVGAVNKPGIYKVSNEMRIYELLAKAGGVKDTAAMECLNLADKVKDGQQVYLPTRQEYQEYQKLYAENNKPTDTSSKSSTDKTQKSQVEVPKPQEIVKAIQEKIRINIASVKELETIPGIGPVIAQRIIEYREKNGPFRQLNDLLQIKGIGEKKLAKIASWVIIP